MANSEALNVPEALQFAIHQLMTESENLRNVQVDLVDENQGEGKPNYVVRIAIEYQMTGCAPLRREEHFRLEGVENATENQVFTKFTEFLITVGMGQYIQNKIHTYINNPIRKV